MWVWEKELLQNSCANIISPFNEVSMLHTRAPLYGEWNLHKLSKPIWISSNNRESVGTSVLIALLFEQGPVWINNLFAAYIIAQVLYHDKCLCINYFYSKMLNKVRLFSLSYKLFS